MIAHVAQKGEGRGRVVLQLGPSGHVSETAVAAALKLAQAFQSEMEALFVEDRQLFDLASFPFVREIAFSGRTTRSLSTEDIARELQYLSASLTRKVVALARKQEIAIECRTVRDERVHALASACAENGPWNVVALAEPFLGREPNLLERLFGEVHGTTGIVVAGSRSGRTEGPVVAVVEEVDRVPPMLRTAERIAAVTGGDARLLLVAETPDRLAWMEGQARLALGPSNLALVTALAAHGDATAVASRLREVRAGFAIAQFGGRLAPQDEDLARLIQLLEGPLLLVR